MDAILHLSDAEEWCLTAKPGAEVTLSVAEEITQEQAAAFAFKMNQQRVGHVWLTVKGFGYVPDVTTAVHIRCTY